MIVHSDPQTSLFFTRGFPLTLTIYRNPINPPFLATTVHGHTWRALTRVGHIVTKHRTVHGSRMLSQASQCRSAIVSVDTSTDYGFANHAQLCRRVSIATRQRFIQLRLLRSLHVACGPLNCQPATMRKGPSSDWHPWCLLMD